MATYYENELGHLAAHSVIDAALAGKLDTTAVDSTIAGYVGATSATKTALDAGYARAAYFDAEKYKTGANTDLQAIQAACAAATSAGQANMVRLSARAWDVGNGLSLSGYTCGLIGVAAGYSGGVGAAPTGTVLHASTQTGAVLDFTGWVVPDSFRGRVEFGLFSLQGSNVADATKTNIGMRNALAALASVYIHDIVISETGGPCVDMLDLYLSDFARITAITPVSAKANDVPYMIFRGCNGNRFDGLGFRSMTASADTGASGALVVTADAVNHSESNEWIAPWFEYLHLPTNGSFISSAAVTQNWRGVYFVDCSKEVGATGTSFVTFAPSLYGDSGGNLWDGVVPGKDGSSTTSPDAGITVTQSRNLIMGVKGYKGTNVVIASGVTNTYTMLGGGVSGATDLAVVDNSGNITNVTLDNFNQFYAMGGYSQQKGSVPGPQFFNPATPANGGVEVGQSGVSFQAVGVSGYLTTDSLIFRTVGLTQMGQADKFAGWQLNGAIEFVSPVTQTTAPAAGAAAALPATPAGYVTITIAGTARLLPYY